MRIRHVIRGRCSPDNANGVITHVLSISHAQLELGHDVEVYGVASRGRTPELLDRSGLTVRAFPALKSPIGVHPELKSHIRGNDRRENTCFILHSSFDPASYGLGRYLHRLGLPYIVVPHSSWAPQSLRNGRLKKAVFKVIANERLVRNAAGVFATAAAEVSEIESYAPGVRSFAVRNSIDLAAIDGSLAAVSDYWTDRLGLTPETDVLTYLGRLDVYQKGLDLLLRAWSAAIAGRQVDAVLCIVGPSWDGGEDRVRELTEELGVGDSVKLLGPLYGREKYEALASSSAYIHTARFETSPYSIQEAMAVGIPAIVTPGTNFSEVVNRYEAGIAVDTDVDSIAHGITTFLSTSPDERRQLGKNARRLVEERHSLQRAARRTVEAYEAAISGAPFHHDD